MHVYALCMFGTCVCLHSCVWHSYLWHMCLLTFTQQDKFRTCICTHVHMIQLCVLQARYVVTFEYMHTCTCTHTYRKTTQTEDSRFCTAGTIIPIAWASFCGSFFSLFAVFVSANCICSFVFAFFIVYAFLYNICIYICIYMYIFIHIYIYIYIYVYTRTHAFDLHASYIQTSHLHIRNFPACMDFSSSYRVDISGCFRKPSPENFYIPSHMRRFLMD
jgi:hypothetical protein